MRKSLLAAALLASALGTGLPAIANAAEPSHTITEDIWIPWRFETMEWLQNASSNYRHHEERAAANQIRKAESWLKFAAGDALPVTKQSLENAANDLHAIAGDLDHGNIVAASHFDSAIARASKALAEWHYFKAKDAVAGVNGERDAARELNVAGRYLRFASESANYQFGPRVRTVYDELDKYGDETQVYEIDQSVLGRYLTTIEGELQRLGTALENAAGTAS
jgi:hypothetical protein